MALSFVRKATGLSEVTKGVEVVFLAKIQIAFLIWLATSEVPHQLCVQARSLFFGQKLLRG